MRSIPDVKTKLIFHQQNSSPAKFHHFDLTTIPLTVMKVKPTGQSFQNEEDRSNIIADVKLQGKSAKAVLVR